MVISSRTPEGHVNRCAVCGHRCRVEPSCLTPDAPCPSCGNLLWFPEKKIRSKARQQLERLEEQEILDEQLMADLPQQRVESASSLPNERGKRPQNPHTFREPDVQAARLLHRLQRRAQTRWGPPEESVVNVLNRIQEPRKAEQLLTQLHVAKSWTDLLARCEVDPVNK